MSRDILKENFSTSVVISESFKKTLLNELKSKPQNNFTTHNKMNFAIFRKWMYGAGAFLSLLLILGASYFYVKNNFPEFLNQDKGYTLSSITGSVKLNNNNVESDKSSLKNGDIIVTGDNGFAVIKSNGTNIYVNANSKVEVNSLNDEIYPEILYGSVYVSSADGDTEVLANAVNTEVINGAGLFNIVEGKSSLSMFVLAAHAGDTNENSTVANISGKVVMGEKEIKPGYEIEISKDPNVKEYEMERENLKSEFVLKVYANEIDEKNDTGTLKDLTAPVVTIVSPASPYKTTSNYVNVAFKSNEDGWYYDTEWTPIKANTEVSIKRYLKLGTNEVAVSVKDKYYNRTVERVTVEYEASATLKWKQEATSTASGVFLKWYGTGVLTSDSYVLFRDGSVYKSIDITNENKSIASYTDTSVVNNKTYNYELKLKRNGVFIADTTKLSITYKEPVVSTDPTPDGTCRVSMSTLAKASALVVPATYTGDHMAKFGWTVSGDCDEHQGYKLVWNKTGSPAYNTNYLGYNYISDNSTKQGVASGLDADTYYFRVCLYRPSTSNICSNYSNQIVISF